MLVGPTYAVDVVTHSNLQDPQALEDAISEYNCNRTGILTNSGGDIAGQLRCSGVQIILSMFQNSLVLTRSWQLSRSSKMAQ